MAKSKPAPPQPSVEQVLMLVKAYPELSKKYGETVCTAGIRLRDMNWIRIYPYPFRLVEEHYQFAKWDVIEVPLQRFSKRIRHTEGVAYSLDLRERVVAAAKEKGNSAAARQFMVGREAVSEWLKRDEAGKLAHDTSPGRPRLVDGEAEKLLRAQIEAHNDATLEEHCQQWAAKGLNKVSRATMHRSLERLKLSRKKDRPSQ